MRQLRHDLRNHLTVVRGLLERDDTQGALGYLDEMAASPALRGGKRFCENETASVVLAAKAEAMERAGITADFAVSLPRELPVADTDLAALLGNRPGQRHGGRGAGGGKEGHPPVPGGQGALYAAGGESRGRRGGPDLATSKADKSAHGFGIPGMREIAERYGGTLDAGAKGGEFELVVCLPVRGSEA